MTGQARERFADFIPAGDLSAYARSLPDALRRDFTGTMTLLRDPSFQDLLITYPRPKREFLVAYGTEDAVESEWVVRGADGRDRRPEEFLEAFARFVQESSAYVDAITILLDRPRDWGTEALAELRRKLASTPERFTEANLQKTHRAVYGKDLADIISMVKHAAEEEEPLLTSTERVDRAFRKIMGGRSFTAEQQRWLDRIRVHLVENLSIDRQDFDNVPVLSREGGWRAADRSFGGRLEELLSEVNEAIAA